MMLRRIGTLAALALIALLGACDDGDGNETDTTSRDSLAADGASDATTDAPADTGAPDLTTPVDTAVEDMSPPDPTDCAAAARAGAGFEIDMAGSPPQIHPAVAFDGTGVWLAYNLRDEQGEGGFDVFAARLHCDGSVDIPSVNVTGMTVENDVDPDIAVGPDGVIVAWARDKSAVDPTDPANMDIVYVVLDRRGELVQAATVLETTRAGVPVTGNAWQSAVAARADGTFAIGGVRADDTNPGFLAFVQNIDATGAVVGDGIDAEVSDTAFDQSARVFIGEAGETILTWFRSTGIDTPDIGYWVEIPANATAPSGPPMPIMDGETGTGGVTYQAIDGVRFWAIGNENGAIKAMVAGGSPVEVGRGNAFEHSPAISMRNAQEGALLHYRVRSGFQNDIVVAPITVNGTTVETGAEINITTPAPNGTPAGPYGTAFTHVFGTVYFVAWAQGMSPDFRLIGRFVDVGGQ